MRKKIHRQTCVRATSADPEGDRGSGPPGKSQGIWVSIEISIWTPHTHTPKKKVGPPGKCWTPSGSLEKYSFLCNENIGPPL